MKFRNPFQILLLAAAVLFCLVACSYCVMMLTRSAEAAYGTPAQPGGLVGFLDDYGAVLLAGLLVALAVLTFAAIATDNYWQRRAAPPADDSAEPTKR